MLKRSCQNWLISFPFSMLQLLWQLLSFSSVFSSSLLQNFCMLLIFFFLELYYQPSFLPAPLCSIFLESCGWPCLCGSTVHCHSGGCFISDLIFLICIALVVLCSGSTPVTGLCLRAQAVCDTLWNLGGGNHIPTAPEYCVTAELAHIDAAKVYSFYLMNW